MRLYRAVSNAEYLDLIASEEFRVGANSMEGKWFAERFEDAIKWGQLFEPIHDFWVIELDMAETTAESFFKIEYLDDIGPARYADCGDLFSATIVNFHRIPRP